MILKSINSIKKSFLEFEGDVIIECDIPKGVRIDVYDGDLTVKGNIEEYVKINVLRSPVLAIQHNGSIFTLDYRMEDPNSLDQIFNAKLIGSGSVQGDTWLIGPNLDVMDESESPRSLKSTKRQLESTVISISGVFPFSLSEHSIPETLQLTLVNVQDKDTLEKKIEGHIVAGKIKVGIPIFPLPFGLKGNVTITGNVSDMANIRAEGLVMINDKKHVLKTKEVLKPFPEPSKAVELNKQDLALRDLR